MHSFVTTGCAKFGHRELTIQLVEPPPIPNLQRMLLGYFEHEVASGSRFLPGETLQLGWATLRICERSDGTFGVQERELVPRPEWREAVDRALCDAWFQKEIAASVGLADELAFPRQDEAILVSSCADGTMAHVLLRLPITELPPNVSGWTLRCAADHEHGEPTLVPLLAVAALHPAFVQFLALPHGVTVTTTFRPKSNAPVGMLRIDPHVYRDGAELAASPGSYLAALQAP
ncbi:MAG TPA: hypothetical protein VLX92_33895 [Kofleriaceae bacterium]|nr:hypothetical protein [Kofleriaceae bacterium]